MKCPTCDHDDTRTEKFLNEQVGRLTRQLMEYKQSATLRDKLAIGALQGITCVAGNAGNNDFVNLNFGNVAEDSYKLADAMMAARKPKPE